MGINSLLQFLRKKNFLEGAFVNIPLNSFKKISIDGHGWLFRNISIIRKSVIYSMSDPTKEIDYEVINIKLIECFLNTNINFFENNVIPVWSWDGKNKPFKSETAKKRKEQTEKKIDELKKILEEIKKNKEKNFFVDEDLLNIYRKKLSEIHEINKVDIDKIKKFSELIGVKFFDADGDGEQECASHVIHGHCDATFSADSDVLALGCHTLITKIIYNYKDGHYCEAYLLPKILSNMEFTYDMFRDFCIMCGTDFNDNIPKIGPLKAYEYIKKYKTIENFAENEKKCIECLKINIVRPIFTIKRKNYEENMFKLGEVKINEDNFNNFIDENNFSRLKKSIFNKKN